MRALVLTAVSTALSTLAMSLPASAVSLYSITDLGSLNPLDLNDSGQIIAGDGANTLLWQNGTTVDLTFMGGRAINNLGQIAGAKNGELFLREADGTVTNLGLPNCFNPIAGFPCGYEYVNDINDAGQILLNGRLGAINWNGTYMESALARRDANGTLAIINGSADFITTNGYEMNDFGQVPYSQTSHGHGLQSGSAFIFNGSTSTQLSSPHIVNPINSVHSAFRNAANDINNQGQIVGMTKYAWEYYRWIPIRQQMQATLWTDANTAINLGTLGGDNSEAKSINNFSQIVGWANNTSNDQTATIWENNQIFDLNNFLVNGTGWQLTSANLINNNQQIVGTGTFNGQTHTFLLNAVSPQSVPEPTGVLGLLGIGAIAFTQRQSRRR